MKNKFKVLNQNYRR